MLPWLGKQGPDPLFELGGRSGSVLTVAFTPDAGHGARAVQGWEEGVEATAASGLDGDTAVSPLSRRCFVYEALDGLFQVSCPLACDLLQGRGTAGVDMLEHPALRAEVGVGGLPLDAAAVDVDRKGAPGREETRTGSEDPLLQDRGHDCCRGAAREQGGQEAEDDRKQELHCHASSGGRGG